MTDLTQIYEDFKNSDIELTPEFWEEQNKKMGEECLRFAEEDRMLNEYKIIRFTI